MQAYRKQNRRDFLKASLCGFGGVLFLPSCLRNYTPFLFFTSDEATLMAEICEQIIPADELGPGATQAGVIYYIDKQLHEVFTDEQQAYRNGLKAIRESCFALYGDHFEEIDKESQLAFLRRMEANDLHGDYWESHSAAGLFSLMVRHSMQGFYGPPRHGGNKDYMSYRMIRYDYPYVIGRNMYRD
jgi:gluconate 2-dehydrogenase gamma chain